MTPKLEQDYRLTLVLAGLGFLVTAYVPGAAGRPVFQGLPGGPVQPDIQGRPVVGTVSGPDDFPAPAIEERCRAEFYLFLTTCTLGMMMLVSSVELLTIYVSLELSSYSLYILVPLRRGDGIDVEAGIKYLFIGAVSSGFMLFGLSYLFGATDSTYLADILPSMAQLLHSPIGIIGLLLAMAGFFFKLSVFPFHFWAPDVYQGGANQVVAFIATATKAAAVALLLRLAGLGARLRL